MLFEFFMNFLNIEQNVFFAFHAILKNIFFLEKQFFLIPRLIEKCPFTYWLNGRWFLQIVDRDSWNLYPLYPLFPDFVSQMWGHNGRGGGGGGAGVMFFSHFMLFTKIVEKNNYFSFNVFFVVFFYAGNIEKCPFTYWLNGEVVSPNSRYREF